jgi:hypothetical protein
MKVLHTIRDTPSNPQGLCALSPSSNEHCYLAYPGSATIGEVQIFDAYNLVKSNICSIFHHFEFGLKSTASQDNDPSS